MTTEDPKVTTYVTYLHPGVFVPEESMRQVDGRDPAQVAREAPDSAFAFSFHDIAETVVYADSEPVTCKSRPLRKSPLYYIDAGKLGIADVEALPGDHDILLSNMRCNHWDVILRCRTGNFRPLESGDIVIDSGQPASRLR